MKEEGNLKKTVERFKELLVCRYDVFTEQYQFNGGVSYRKGV